ncbi:MAG: DNA polymerase/3'-5' exonuclease PolX [Elusimicrobia bacterium ADurb.Bin231]|nr:MAG: DNA polymerase/3'-5' exonuclease PolX [Elusimicrobia bacterium ADurb.Bin231]
MIDLHTHTLFSDGALLPSELVCRTKAAGYEAIAITDHCDFSNLDFVIKRIKRITKILSSEYGIKVIAGTEITYVPPVYISKAVSLARKLGAGIVVVHGESPVEPVPIGTNKAGILAGCDILAHPGFITEEDVILAAKKNVYLEITTRRGHKKGNLHVASLSLRLGASMVLNTDTHEPEDLLDLKKINDTLKSAGISKDYLKTMTDNSRRLLR